MEPQWLRWAKSLQAIAQTGLTYSHDAYDIERYEQVRSLASEIMATYAEIEATYVRDLFAGEVGHTTPKVDVRGAVFREDTILLVRERSDGLWTLPGGWADIGESPAESVVREVYEESGYQTRAVRLLALYDRDRQGHSPLPYYVYKLFFLCEIEAEVPRFDRSAAHGAAFMEIEEVAFFAADRLPPLSLGRVTAAQIARCFAHYRNPTLPTDFE